MLSPGYQNLDLGLMKNANLGEHLRLQLRVETFNTFNHANFSGVDAGLGDGNFGNITGTRAPRRMQMSAKLNF